MRSPPPFTDPQQTAFGVALDSRTVGYYCALVSQIKMIDTFRVRTVRQPGVIFYATTSSGLDGRMTPSLHVWRMKTPVEPMAHRHYTKRLGFNGSKVCLIDTTWHLHCLQA